MKNKRRIIGIAAAALLALIGTISLVGYVRSATDDAVAQETLVDVYVVDEFVPQGAAPETIAAAVKVEQVPARLKQDGALTDLDALGDQVASSDLEPGDQLVAARLASKDVTSDEVADKVQVSVLLEAERAVGGALEKGDLVGVYLSFVPFGTGEAGEGSDVDTEAAAAEVAAAEAAAAEAFAATGADTPTGTEEQSGPTKTPNVSGLEFRHVLVTNVQTINPPVNPEDSDDNEAGVAQVTGTQYVVTIALSPEQSERFVFATEFGEVTLSLDPASVADDGVRPVTLADVFTVVK